MTIQAHHRGAERADLNALFAYGSSVLMLAPRRIGKTWLLNKIGDDLGARGWLCIKIDVEGMRTENEFLRALCNEIEKLQAVTTRIKTHFLQRFKQLTTHVQDGNLAAAIGDIDPRDFLQALIGSLNGEEKDTLILVDEISLFINELANKDSDKARSLLYHLRKLQQEFPRVRWFLTGSVGLDVIARRHNMLGALLGIDTYSLEPFGATAAKSYIEELCASGQITHPFSLDEGSFECLTSELGWLSPYYLRQVALQLRPTGLIPVSHSHPLATVEDVKRALTQLLSPNQRLHFAAWEEHIDKNFSAVDKRRLRSILDIASQEINGEIEVTYLTRLGLSGEELTKGALRVLLSCLEIDGFLEEVDARWRFRSGLLRRYWKEYMVND